MEVNKARRMQRALQCVKMTTKNRMVFKETYQKKKKKDKNEGESKGEENACPLISRSYQTSDVLSGYIKLFNY